MGTAGFARDLVSGYNRVPAPPPKITAATDFVFVTALALGRSAAFVAAASPRIVIAARLRDATDEDEVETARPRLREKKKTKIKTRQSESESIEFVSSRLGQAGCAPRERSIDSRVARAFDRPTTRARVTIASIRTISSRSFVRSFVHRRVRTNDE